MSTLIGKKKRCRETTRARGENDCQKLETCVERAISEKPAETPQEAPLAPHSRSPSGAPHGSGMVKTKRRPAH